MTAPPFVVPDNETTAAAPPDDPSNPLPVGTVFTTTNADNELIARVPNPHGGFYRIGAGVGADPATVPAHIASVMRVINCNSPGTPVAGPPA